jgi:hypothetical protein
MEQGQVWKKKVYYCAWCTHIEHREPGIFYSSKICKKHLAELTKQMQDAKIKEGKTRIEK